MSSPLTLIVLGQAYFLNVVPPNVLPTQNNSICNQNATESLPKLAEVKRIEREIVRSDYMYTPGIGAHKIHTDATTWNEARSICKSEGGDLAVINSPAEATLLKGYFERTQSFMIDSSDSDNILIGYSDPQRLRKFITVNGKPLEDSGFAIWRSGEPNNWIGSGEFCGAMHVEGTLNDIACDVRTGFICELSRV